MICYICRMKVYDAVCIVQRGTGSKSKSSAVEHNTGNFAIGSSSTQSIGR